MSDNHCQLVHYLGSSPFHPKELHLNESVKPAAQLSVGVDGEEMAGNDKVIAGSAGCAVWY